MLSRSLTRSRHKNAPRVATKTAFAFQQWVRGRGCYLQDRGACATAPGRKFTEFAHVDHGGDKGMGTKTSDRYGIPLCPKHHDEQHGQTGAFSSRGGWPTFELKYGFSALSAAKDYWQAWPGRIAWEAKHEA